MKTFRQLWVTVTAPPIVATPAEIEEEPMFFNADKAFLYNHIVVNGNHCPITERFLITLFGAEWWETDDQFGLDTRSHMLMEGWYPAIPGWHHDFVERGGNGQPDYDRDLDEREIFAVVVDTGTGSLTEFAAPYTDVEVPWPVDGSQPVYGHWDSFLHDNPIPTKTLESGRIVLFTENDFHRAMPATGRGWRWFARLTIGEDVSRVDGAKVRRQVQAYLPTLNKGW